MSDTDSEVEVTHEPAVTLGQFESVLNSRTANMEQKIEKLTESLEEDKKTKLEVELNHWYGEQKKAVKADDAALEQVAVTKINELGKRYNDLVNKPEKVDENKVYVETVTSALNKFLVHNPWGIKDHKEYDEERSKEFGQRVTELMKQKTDPYDLLTILATESAKREKKLETIIKKKTPTVDPTKGTIKIGSNKDAGEKIKAILSKSKKFAMYVKKDVEK